MALNFLTEGTTAEQVSDGKRNGKRTRRRRESEL